METRTDWEMYSDEGNSLVSEKVAQLIFDIDHDCLFRYQLEGRVHAIFREVSCAGYSEVYDTEPRGHIYREVDAACDRHGWKGVDEF